MKVLLVNDFWEAGGAEEVFRRTGECIQDQYAVSYYYKSKNYSKADGLLDYIFSFRNKSTFLEKLKKESPDIVHIHNYYHVLSPSILYSLRQYKKNHPVKVLMTAHDYHLICPNSGLTHFKEIDGKRQLQKVEKQLSIWDKLFLQFDNRGFAYSTAKKLQWILAYDILKLYDVIDLILSPSKFLKDTFQYHHPSLPEIKVVRNPIKLKKNQEGTHLPVNNTVPTQTLRMIFLGRISPEKGLLELIESLGKIDKTKFVLDIYGSGEEAYMQGLKDAVAQHALHENIHFRGYVSSDVLDTVMNNMDAAILPSLWFENAPLSVLEAAIKGLQILTLNYGGMKEMAEIAGNYQLFELNDFTSLERAIDHAIQEKNANRTTIPSLENNAEYKKMVNYEAVITKVYKDILTDV
ncbi:glycosyltransferase [Dyadobacter tibetensis]|uniref:glycosyltransferase n=1 Tax=Dyadobacter tibetensis TaxID=1211851 RepID=UPI000470A421|nr:glycosyltransferase [Dyadobacter tibetensis]